jgi:hypothetical protein
MFKMSKKSDEKIVRRPGHSMFSQNCFIKNNIFCVVCKRQILLLKWVLHETFLSFYTRHKKYRFSAKTCHMHIECWDVCAKFLFEFFWRFKNVFSVVGAYASMFWIEFPDDTSILAINFMKGMKYECIDLAPKLIGALFFNIQKIYLKTFKKIITKICIYRQ